jgi:uncharacterized protein (TIGR02145 family)
LKATSGWDNNGNGTDNYGFSALPGGDGYPDGSSFRYVGGNGFWWSASEYDKYFSGYHAYYQLMYGGDNAGWISDVKSLLLSVRCIQD